MGVGDDFADQVGERMKEAAYAAVGLGVLGVQRLQVRRREVAKQVEEVAKQVEPQVREVAGRLQRLAVTTDEAVNPVLDRLEDRLPDTTRDLVRSARVAAVDARDTVLNRAASGSS